MHILFQTCAESKEKRKWQQEAGIFRVCCPRRSHLHQTISIGFDSEPNSCFELGRLKQLVSFQIFLRRKRERNQGVRVTRYYFHKTSGINPSASSFSLPFSFKPPLAFSVFLFSFWLVYSIDWGEKKCTVNMSNLRCLADLKLPE